MSESASHARLARDLPAAQLRSLQRAGHFVQEDAPEELCALLEEFLETAARGAVDAAPTAAP